MKYIKLFESKLLDSILDKISETGKESLTEWEKDFLKKYDTEEGDKMEQDKIKRDNKMKSFGNYDPRKDDTTFYKDIDPDMDNYMKNMDDETYETSKIEIMWNELDEIDMDEFLETYKVMPEYGQKSWDKLSTIIKDKFKNFLEKKGFIKN